MTEGFPQLSLLNTQHSINYSHTLLFGLKGTWKVSESAWRQGTWRQGQADD